MKRLRVIIMLAAASILAAAGLTLSQNWSPPVAVTSGAGEDHHVDVQYNWVDDRWWVAWDRTVNGNEDIYQAFFDPTTGVFEETCRLTFRPEVDEKPAIAYGMLNGNGVFFQGSNGSALAIFYVAQNDTGFSLPWLTLYSDANLYEPDYSPIETDFGGFTIPALFLHSDSAALEFDYTYVGGEWNFEVPQDTAFYVEVASSGYPIHTHDGRWNSSPPVSLSWQQFVWEKEINGRGEIEYYYQIVPESTLYVETCAGLVPNTNYSYHKPILGWGWYGIMFLERELQSGATDIARCDFDAELEQWSLPTPFFETPGNEQNPDEEYGSLVFETDINGNWDIGFYHPWLGQIEYVDLDQAEDCNPVLFKIGNHYNAFWESNRDGTWKIYWSQRDIVGVEPEAGQAFPEKFDVSVYPNPGNAEFKIALDLPAAGPVTAAIYDLSGREVARSYRGPLSAGRHSLDWDGSGLPSGIYLLRVESINSVEIQKIALLK